MPPEEPLKFLLDANLPRTLNNFLKNQGYNVKDIRDFLAPDTPDEDISKIAQQEGRILLTRDLDFANILLYPPSQYPGIIVLKTKGLKTEAMKAILTSLIETMKPQEFKHSLIILEPHKVRIKR